ncbi:hypothetical protein [Nonomuraea sp. NPDC049480]|uniref:hypothetical protein n=1 Tax=Nonomuraea sp. NPDC049480 TaxID=3364353 RepID=UPI0037BBD905
MVITGLGGGIFATLAAPFVADVLGGKVDAYGLFLSAQAVGGIAGGLALAARPGNATPRALFGMALAGVLGERLGIAPTLCLHAGGLTTAGLLVMVKSERHTP